MNENKKNRVIDNPTKRAGPSVQGIMETQIKTVEAEKNALCPHRYSINFALAVECPQMKLQKLLNSTNSKTRRPGLGIVKKIVTYDLLFHMFPTIAPRLHGPNSTRINKIRILTRKSYLSEGKFSSS